MQTRVPKKHNKAGIRINVRVYQPKYMAITVEMQAHYPKQSIHK